MNDPNFNLKRAKVSTVLKTVRDSSFEELKEQYDTVLNTHRSTRNDEPTPIGLVSEMLGFVPSEVWTRDNLKVIDLCCGLGNFPIVLWKILGQQSFNNSVLLNELSPERLGIAKEILQTNNVRCGDALTIEGMYDVVVANPPYALLNSDGKRASKNHNLINAFIDKALDITKKNGFVVFVVPNSWCSPSKRNKLCRHITSLQFHHLNLMDCKKWFPKIGSSFSYFVVENTPHTKPFRCVSLFKKELTDEMLDSQTRDWIPLHWNNAIKELLADTVDREDYESFKIETSSDLHNYTKKLCLQDTEDVEHPYEIIHTFRKTRWSSKPHKFQTGWKLLLNLTGYYGTIVRKDVGVTQSVAFVRCETEIDANNLKTILDRSIYKKLNDLHRFGNFNNLTILSKFGLF